MPDIFVREKRSKVMAGIKSRDTKPERIVRSVLHRLGYRFRLHCRDLPGTPDIVLPRYRKAILVHGCFWHGHPGCRRSARPTSNAAFWEKKLSANAVRDAQVRDRLIEAGWDVLVIWQCETRDIAGLENRLCTFITGTSVISNERSE